VSRKKKRDSLVVIITHFINMLLS